MANASSPQLVLTTWLDDQSGSAKLTAKQRELVANYERSKIANKDKLVAGKQAGSEQSSTQHSVQLDPSESLVNLLKPQWKANEIISMFHEERQKIVQRGQECKNLLANTDSVLAKILSLKDLYLFVSPRTSQLHLECKNIIQERSDLRQSYEKISTSLNKQEELRSIFRRMPDIKNQILTVLNSVCQGYQKRQQQEGTPLDEYYGRFFIECRRIKELTSQLESCLSSSNTDELVLHLEEIYTLYFDIREQLIEPAFRRNLGALVSKSDRNYCDLLRQTSASLVRILRNEIQLFNQIFSSPSTPVGTSNSTTTNTAQVVPATPETSNLAPTTAPVPGADTEARQPREFPAKRQVMNAFLELLCRTFYEHLRPVVIHVNHLETLAELYKLVMETMLPEVSEECYQLTMSTLGEDIQERMVFRAEVFIQESVLDYKPSRGDLAYPEKLEIVSGGDLKDFQAMWYPTVQRTVLALFYLNRVFDTLTFHELAKEVVLACFKSLDIAQRLVDERHGGTKIEATLFLSKHLAIIRDQLQSYGIERVQFQAQSSDGGAESRLVEIDTRNLESMLRLFQENELNEATNESLWSQLNETILSGTKWTLRATRMRS